jgi:DNA helicase-2/ATP-dependent DNA helicase PcrA
VEGLKNGSPGVYDETGGKPAKPSDLVRLVDGASVERYIQQNPTVSIQSKIDMLNERLTVKIKDEFLGKGVKYTEPEKKAILRAYRGKYGANVWKKSIFELYQQFLTGQIQRGYDVDIPGNALDVYDLAALAYLYKRVKETEVI